MDVWLVIGGWHYEGKDVISVCSSEARATATQKRVLRDNRKQWHRQKFHRYDFVDVEQMVVDTISPDAVR